MLCLHGKPTDKINTKHAEFIRSKRKEDTRDDPPDIHQTHIAFLRAEHPSLFGPNSDAYKKELFKKRLSSPLQQHLVSSSTDESKAETFVKKRKIPILSE